LVSSIQITTSLIPAAGDHKGLHLPPHHPRPYGYRPNFLFPPP